MNNQIKGDSVRTTLTSVVAASSTRPFLTAFKVTLGIGVANLVLFFGAITAFFLLGLLTLTIANQWILK